jgi:hypothetical protein
VVLDDPRRREHGVAIRAAADQDRVGTETPARPAPTRSASLTRLFLVVAEPQS